MGNKIDRRDFLALMGIGGAAAVTMSCGQPTDYFQEKWHPWVEPVEGDIPYVPRFYATTTREARGCGLHIKTVDGRAIKVEGNPEHPINQGKVTAAQQAAVQGLYGSDRVKAPFKGNSETTWREANALFAEKLNAAKGKNISVLTYNCSGATEDFWTRFVAENGSGRLIRYQPFVETALVMASEKVFGQNAAPFISLADSDYICSLGARFLESWGDVTAHSRDFAGMRERRAAEHPEHNAHVQFEASLSMTGANADLVLEARPGSETQIALVLLKILAGESDKLTGEEKEKIAALTANVSIESAASASGLKAEMIKHVAEGLAHAKSPVVLPAESLALGKDSVAHHAAVLLINKALGSIGKHYNYAAAKPAERVPSHQGITDLISDLNAGSVDLLVIRGVNPLYSLPAELGFEAAVKKAGFTVVFTDHLNETTRLGDLILPDTHDLESWGQVNTYAGISMLMQPVMTPRWVMKQAEDQIIDLLNTLAGEEGTKIEGTFKDQVKTFWQAQFGASDSEWHADLQRGGRYEIAEGTDLAVSGNLSDDIFSSVGTAPAGDTALVIVESARFGDGSTANRDWLLELPDAMTGIVWDSWLEIGEAKAASLNLKWGDVVEVKAGSKSISVPVAISQTTSDHVVTLATGLGHKGMVERYQRGVNAFDLLNTELNDAGVYSTGVMAVTISGPIGHEKLATFHIPGKGDQLNTQLSNYSEFDKQYTRDLYKMTVLGAAAHGGGHGDGPDHSYGHYNDFNRKSKFPMHSDKNMYPNRDNTKVYTDRNETFYDEYKWEMAVDLNKCTGCGSCVTACYAENNLPVVGKDQVIKGREMAWVRINRYLYHANGDGTGAMKAGMMPMMCQQCGNAPCESVCPSLATYHTKEGLNAMVYNRCVGTRYCANNCSYKVRRFNWFTFEYTGDMQWQMNPEVSVRSKGVMEKCTFCSHRVRVAKATAKFEGRRVADGEVMTACQQVCPSHAITFGDFTARSEGQELTTQIDRVAHDARAYRALDDHIMTKPGVSYLERVVYDNKEQHHG